MCSFSGHRTLVEFPESADLNNREKVSEATITKRLIFFHKDLEVFLKVNFVEMTITLVGTS